MFGGVKCVRVLGNQFWHHTDSWEMLFQGDLFGNTVLLGGSATPPKNMTVNWDDYSQYFWENAKFMATSHHQPEWFFDEPTTISFFSFFSIACQSQTWRFEQKPRPSRGVAVQTSADPHHIKRQNNQASNDACVIQQKKTQREQANLRVFTHIENLVMHTSTKDSGCRFIHLGTQYVTKLKDHLTIHPWSQVTKLVSLRCCQMGQPSVDVSPRRVGRVTASPMFIPIQSPKVQQPQVYDPITGWCFQPLWKIWVRQLGRLATQYFWENSKNGNQSPPTRSYPILIPNSPIFNSHMSMVPILKSWSLVPGNGRPMGAALVVGSSRESRESRKAPCGESSMVVKERDRWTSWFIMIYHDLSWKIIQDGAPSRTRVNRCRTFQWLKMVDISWYVYS